MKRFLLTLTLAVVLSAGAHAQWDSKFYNPDKDCHEIDSLLFEAEILPVGSDSLYTLVARPDGKAKAAVFFYHGNASNLTAPGHQKLFRLLTGAGYEVFAFDYPGFGHSTGTPTHQSIAQAADSLFRQWVDRKEVRGLPVILYGQSIGAQIASTLAVENKDKVAALVLDGCSPSFTALAEQFAPAEYRPYIKQAVVSPYSVEKSVGQLNGLGVLYIHSKTDPIDYKGAWAMYEATQAAKKDFWTYQGDHVQAPALYPREFIERIDKLIK